MPNKNKTLGIDNGVMETTGTTVMMIIVKMDVSTKTVLKIMTMLMRISRRTTSILRKIVLKPTPAPIKKNLEVLNPW